MEAHHDQSNRNNEPKRWCRKDLHHRELKCGLVRQGYAVLAIDFDPQANLTMALGFKSPGRYGIHGLKRPCQSNGRRADKPVRGNTHHS